MASLRRLRSGIFHSSSAPEPPRPALGCGAAALLALACGGSTVAPAEPAPVADDVAHVGDAPQAAPSAPAAAPEGRPVPPSPSAGCGKAVVAAGAKVARAGRVQTPYLLTLPEGYDGKTPVPLVFAFHGRTRSHQSMFEGDASQLAAQLGPRYAVAYVKSVGPGFDQPREQRDNLQVFDALYPELLGSLCIDAEQVFALGHSSGGLFSELLACERAPQLRGIAAVAGAMVRPECPGRSAALIIHGERDSVVSISRGSAVRDHFVAANGCSSESAPVGTTAGCVAYAGCEPGLPVEWCSHGESTYQDTNHGWPSFASPEIARFFGSLGRLPHVAGTPLVGGANEASGASGAPQVTFGASATGTSSVKQGATCARLTRAGENPWDAQLAFSGLRLEPGRDYVLDYRLWTSALTDVRVKLGLEAAPYNEYWQQNVVASPEPRRFQSRVRLVEQAPGVLALGFQFAGSYARQVPLELCIDQVDLAAAASP